MKNTPFVGKVIRRLRLEAKMTQEDLCAATDYVLAPGYLSRLERSPVNFSWPIFEAICEALSVDSADIIREAKTGVAADEVKEEATEYKATRRDRVVPVVDMQGDTIKASSLVLPASMPAGSYGYLINTVSMESDRGGLSYFRHGYAIISPNETVESGQDCLVEIDSVLILCRYEYDGRHHWITYLNSSYPREVMMSRDQIRGLVTGFIWFNPDT